MNSLLEKALNCYSTYLTRLSIGKTDQNYDLLYDAILLLKNNVSESKYTQYYENNLTCQTVTRLEEVPEGDKVIGFELSTSETILESFEWVETPATTLKTYTITTDSVLGYNFLYFSIPSDANVIIYDALNTVIYNSEVSSPLYAFELVGTALTSNNQINKVYRKKNVYNSNNPITFNINLS